MQKGIWGLKSIIVTAAALACGASGAEDLTVDKDMELTTATNVDAVVFSGNHTLTLKQGDRQYLTFKTMTGTGKIVMNEGAYIQNDSSADATIPETVTIEVVGTTSWANRLSGNTKALKVNGPLTGSGDVYLNFTSGCTGAELYGDNSNFRGTIYLDSNGSTRDKFGAAQAGGDKLRLVFLGAVTDNGSTLFSNGTIHFGSIYTSSIASGAHFRSIDKHNTFILGALNRDDDRLTLGMGDDANSYAKIIKVGTGRLEIGDTRHREGTIISNGVLQVASPYALCNHSGSIEFEGGTLAYGTNLYTTAHEAVTNDYASLIKNSNGPISIDTMGHDVTWATALDSSNKGGLVKKGEGTLSIPSFGSYTGATIISNGTIRLTADTEPSSGAVITFNGGSLVYGTGVTNGRSSYIKNSEGAISVDTGDNDITWGVSTLQTDNPNAVGITKKGAGTLTLSTFWNTTLDLFCNAKYTNRIENGTVSISNARKNSRYTFASKLLGSGTLVFRSFEGKGGFAIADNGALSEFDGTVEWANVQDESEMACLFMPGSNHDLDLSRLRFRITGNPESALQIGRSETTAGKTLTFGAFDHLYPNAQIKVNNPVNFVIAGTHGDSTMNGTFTNAKIYIAKNGADSKLTIGKDFSVVSGSTLTVNEGTLVVEAGATLPKLTNSGTLLVDVSSWTDDDYTSGKELFTTTTDATLGTVSFTGARPGYVLSAAVDTTTGKVKATATLDGKRWTGKTDTDWNTASNWSDSTVPTRADNVVIDGDATISWTTVGDCVISNLYLNGTLTLTMPKNTGTGDRGLHLWGVEGSSTSKIVLQGARLSTVSGRSLTCAVPMEIKDNTDADESWITGLGASWTQTGAFTGTGTLRVRGWTSGSATYLNNDNTSFEGTIIIDGDSSNGSCFKSGKSFGPKMKLIGEGTKKIDRILPNANEFVDGVLTMQLGSIWQDSYFNCAFRVNINRDDSHKLTLEIGDDTNDSLIMGQFGDGPDSTNTGRPSSYTRIVKKGASTMQVYRPSLRFGWELQDGTVEAIGPNALEGYLQDKSISPISFTGGTLKYGTDTTTDAANPAAVTTDWSDYIAGSSAAIKVETTGADVTWATALADSNTAHEIVKTGKGRLILTAAPTWNSDTDKTTVTVGYRQGSVLMPTSVSYVLGTDTASGKTTRVKTTTIGTTTYNEFYNQPGLMVIVR